MHGPSTIELTYRYELGKETVELNNSSTCQEKEYY